MTANSPSPSITAARVASCQPFTPARRLHGRFTYSARTGDLTVIRARTVTLAGGTYCFHNVTLSGKAVLRMTGTVTIRLTGKLNARDGRLNNTTDRPASLRIESSFTGLNGVKLVGGSGAYLRLYAPQTDVTLFGSAPLFGSFLGETLRIVGQAVDPRRRPLAPLAMSAPGPRRTASRSNAEEAGIPSLFQNALPPRGYGLVNSTRSAQKSRSEKSLFPVEARTIRNESGTSTSSSGSPGVPL